MDDLLTSIRVAASGLRAQGVRLRTVAENLANAGSTAATPDGTPYRRKTVSFAAEIDQASGARLVGAPRPGVDGAPFRLVYDPAHPAADVTGHVKLPNVNPLLELADLREAQRSYEANLQSIDEARSMLLRTIDLLRG